MGEQEVVDERLERLLSEHPPGGVDEAELWGAQFDLGLAWVDFPEGKGGCAVSPRWQSHVNERIVAAGGSVANRARNVIGVGMGAATLLEHGDEALHGLLRPLFTCEEIWCQLFSEPGAGSDLAALATAARREGDEWILTGQKVWTTLAHVAKWGLLVARTDPDAVKHAGMTYFLLDMEADGVEVRPLYQITGEAEFNEVHLDEVRIPDAHRLGDVGAGWRVAMTTLMNERVALGAQVQPRGSGPIGQALAAWRDHGHEDPALRDRLVSHWIDAEAMRLTTIRAAEARQQGTPGPEGSTAKIHWAESNKAITAFTMELLGAEAMLMPGGYRFERPTQSAMRSPVPQRTALRARANSIEGGTTEVLKNVLAERVLGLPGEPRVDKDRPWREVPRS